MNVIGVDMGGTNIRASIINEKMEIIDEIHGKTPISAPSILKELIELVNLLLLRNSVTIKAIGVGASGIIHPKTGEVVGAGDTIPGWLGTKLKEHLGEHLPFPVFVGNDVNVAALGEGWVTGAKNFAFVSIGTGLGGAIVHDGSVITGDKGGAGEFGHSILYPNGIICGCGKKGCAEKYVSGTAIGVRAMQIEPSWDSFRLIEEASIGNKKAVQVIEQFTIDLSYVLMNIQSMFDPPIIILGGGLTASYHVWEDFLANALKIRGGHRKINLRISQRSNEVGVLGAAKTALDELKVEKCTRKM